MEKLSGTKVNDLVNSFVVHYFNTFDTNRKALESLFRDDSKLTCQDTTFTGAPLIVSALEALPSEYLTHSISSIDWKQLPEACLVFVCGKQHHPARPPLPFSQVFHLHHDDKVKFYVYRAIYKVHPHGVGGPTLNFQSVQTDGPVKAQVVSTRSCTKVHKQGYALGRSVDLTKFNNYNELISELDELFEFNGELKNRNTNWLVVYTDDEGDMMLVGDDPWEEFCGMVRKMFIYTREEAQRMNPGTSNSRRNALEGLQPQQYLDFDSDLRSELLKMSKLVNNLASGQDQEKVTDKKRRNLNVEWPVIAASAGAVILVGVASLRRG